MHYENNDPVSSSIVCTIPLINQLSPGIQPLAALAVNLTYDIIMSEDLFKRPAFCSIHKNQIPTDRNCISCSVTPELGKAASRSSTHIAGIECRVCQIYEVLDNSHDTPALYQMPDGEDDETQDFLDIGKKNYTQICMAPIILHLDMDSFFASVEVRENPALQDVPVIVGADPKEGKGRGVVSTASYEARKCGVHSGMPISRAYRLCPQGVFLPVNFPPYIQTSERIMAIMERYGDRLEQVSIDEAYLDVSRTESYPEAKSLATRMKEEIRKKEQLTCSIGIGPSRVVAKIASDFKKPDGLTVVLPEKVKEFLFPLPVHKIPGIGKKTEKELTRRGIITIGMLAGTDVQVLHSVFGRWGVYMHTLAQGMDIASARSGLESRSISREVTFETDTDRESVLTETMDTLCREVQQALIDEGYTFRTITIKVRDTRFITRTRSRTLGHPSRDLSVITKTARELLQEFLDGKKIRLLGLRLSHLMKEQSMQTALQKFL
jgi:DNA polymerase IV (DinB-like DNA polymerase)